MLEGDGFLAAQQAQVQIQPSFMAFFGLCKCLTCLGSFGRDCPAAEGACPACQNTYQKLSDKYPPMCCWEEVW